ncbi:MAG: LemA family protein [Fimbriimonas sp.]
MNELTLLLFPALLLVLLIWFISTKNRFTRLEYLIKESWANVDVSLRRRHDLIPNLVETVKGYAAHERELLERLSHARENAIQSPSANSETEVSRLLSSVIMRSEAYPALKSSDAFTQLMGELVNTEDRIAAARRFYNANVRDYNISLESFPSSLLAQGRLPKEMYEIDSVQIRLVPQVSL